MLLCFLPCRENARSSNYVHRLELAVVVLPLTAWGDCFDSIPMFYKLALSNTEEVIKGRVDTSEGAFTNR